MVKLIKGFKRVSSIVVLLMVMLLISASAHARIYKSIVAFGDSLSDHYGLQSYLGPYDPVSNPNGVLEVWSNGDIWVEYLADNWGAALDNNAIAGAMSRGHENASVQMMSDAGTLPDLGLVGQVATYISTSPAFDPEETLFTIWIGGNDLLQFGRGESHTSDPSVLIADAMENITDAVVSLYSEGVTHLLILNLPDIGRTPAYNKKTPEEIAAVTQLVQAYNTALGATIEQLTLNLTGITIDFFDMFSYMNEMIDSNAFVNVTDTYMELDADGNKTGNVNGDADDYLFWDNIHPMTKAHEKVGNEVDATLYSMDDGGGSSGCFISSLAGKNSSARHNGSVWVFISFCMGITGFVVKNGCGR